MVLATQMGHKFEVLALAAH